MSTDVTAYAVTRDEDPQTAEPCHGVAQPGAMLSAGAFVVPANAVDN